MSNPTPADFEQLRKSFDGNDNFMTGSSISGKARSGHAERVANIPIMDSWALNNEQVRQLLLKVFPRAQSRPGVKISRTQRKRMMLWMVIIQFYFRMGWTAGRITMHLNAESIREVKPIKSPKSGWKLKHIEDTVRRIRKAAAGLRTTGKPRTTKGHPKRQIEILASTAV